VGFGDAIRTCLRKYVTFSGRASRPEYWWFVLFTFLGSAAAGILDAGLFGTGRVETGPGTFVVESEGPISGLFSLFVLLPSFSAGWRRMHDTGRSGVYLLYPVLVIFGIGAFVSLTSGLDPVLSGDVERIAQGASGAVVAIAVVVLLLSPLIVLWWLTRPSQPGPNQYGPNPSEVTP
jgi:uncharacterized membrane protein YhaH (DUF805 family)